MIGAILAVFAGFQFHYGAVAGGWETELGSLHYYFGLYIAGDALRALGEAVSE